MRAAPGQHDQGRSTASCCARVNRKCAQPSPSCFAPLDSIMRMLILAARICAQRRPMVSRTPCPGGQSLHPAADEVLARARDGCHEATVPRQRGLITIAQVAGRSAPVNPEIVLTFLLALPGSIEDARAG